MLRMSYLQAVALRGRAATAATAATRRLPPPPPPPLPLSSSPLSTSASLSGRPHIGRPRHPFWERKKMLAVSKPSYPEPHPDTASQWADCPRVAEEEERRQKKVANEFELLYAAEMRRYLEESNVIVLFHVNEFKHYPQLFVCRETACS